MEALRGEIGASMVKSRIMETILLYMIDTLSSQFTNIKLMMEDTILREKGKWYNAIEEYRIELGLTWENLRALDKPMLKKIVKEYDTIKWYEGMSKKQSLRFYIKEKSEIQYDLCYRNSLSSTFYARARINSLKLEEQKGRGKVNYNKSCRLCEEEEEDLVHFITKCKNIEQKRDYNLLDREIKDPEERMRTLLFRKERRQDIGKMIKNLWDLRRQLLEEKEKKVGKDTNIQTPQITTQGCKKKKQKKQEKRKKVNPQLKVVKGLDRGKKKLITIRKKKKA